jgi:predicted transcriptional regulator
MSDNTVNRVLIVDDNNKVIGIITRADIVKSLIKQEK